MWAVCCQTPAEELGRILVGMQTLNDWGIPKFTTQHPFYPNTRGRVGGERKERENRAEVVESHTFMSYSAELWEKGFRIRNSLWQGIFWAGWACQGIVGFTDRRIFDSWWTDEFRHGSVSRKQQGQMETHSLSLILIFFFFFQEIRIP